MGVMREEFRTKNFWLELPDHTDFFNSRLSSNKAYYVAWRFVWAFYHCSWLLTGLVETSFATDKQLDRWFAYLSHWVYLLLTAHCLMDAGVVWVNFRRKPHKDEEALSSWSPRHPLPWYLKLTWCMSNVVSTGCVMVTLWYWMTEAKGKEFTALRLHFHGVNALYVVLNIIVSKSPIRLLHAVYPVLFGVVYTSFTAVYYVSGGTNQKGEPFIYKTIDWSNPLRAFIVSSISNFIFIPIVHICLWCVSIGVDRLCQKYYLQRTPNTKSKEDLSNSESS